MTQPTLNATLQDCVSRFARSLTVSEKLLGLHPRGVGNPGKHAALAPAITLGVLSAFEGFAEDFTAMALYLRGDGFGQIANQVGNWNNPTVGQFTAKLTTAFPLLGSTVGHGFSLDVYKPPAPGKSGWQNPETLTWSELVTASEAWMQVRHCLTHGQATGWRSEKWPPSLKAKGKAAPNATTVLRPMKNGLHSLALHGALSCQRIYVAGGRHVADLVAETLSQTLDWTDVPLFDSHRLAPSWP